MIYLPFLFIEDNEVDLLASVILEHTRKEYSRGLSAASAKYADQLYQLQQQYAAEQRRAEERYQDFIANVMEIKPHE